MDKLKKLEEITEKQEVLDEISQAESIEDIQKILSTNGLDVSAEELTELVKSAESAELDENALGDVSGGSLFGMAKNGFKILSHHIRELAGPIMPMNPRRPKR